MAIVLNPPSTPPGVLFLAEGEQPLCLPSDRARRPEQRSTLPGLSLGPAETVSPPLASSQLSPISTRASRCSPL